MLEEGDAFPEDAALVMEDRAMGTLLFVIPRGMLLRSSWLRSSWP
jgi:hypothetical protein